MKTFISKRTLSADPYWKRIRSIEFFDHMPRITSKNAYMKRFYFLNVSWWKSWIGRNRFQNAIWHQLLYKKKCNFIRRKLLQTKQFIYKVTVLLSGLHRSIFANTKDMARSKFLFSKKIWFLNLYCADTWRVVLNICKWAQFFQFVEIIKKNCCQ